MNIPELLFGKPNPRGTIYVEAVGGGLFNKDTKYKGHYEVEILEETDKLYRVKFKNEMFNRDFPEWIEKSKVDLINSL